MSTVIHDQGKRKNNRAELSHQPTRQQERQMRRFKSAGQAQRFLSAHASINNLFRVGRHQLKAAHYRIFRERAFSIWSVVTCAQHIELALFHGMLLRFYRTVTNNLTVPLADISSTYNGSDFSRRT